MVVVKNYILEWWGRICCWWSFFFQLWHWNAFMRLSGGLLETLSIIRFWFVVWGSAHVYWWR